MGIWGLRAFESDDAQNFAREVIEDGPVALEEAFDVVLDEDDVQAPEGARAVAAAELLAALLNGDFSALPPELREWAVQQKTEDLANLRAPALSALDRVAGETSELRELWEQTDGYAAWLADLARIRQSVTAR